MIGLELSESVAYWFVCPMIRSFVFCDGKLAGRDLEPEALRLVRSDKGMVLWIDLESPTPEETKRVLEELFQFHPLAIEDCLNTNSIPKAEDYGDYMFVVTNGVYFSRAEKFRMTELDLFIGRDYLVSYHVGALRSVSTTMDRLCNNQALSPRGGDRLAHALLDAIVDNHAAALEELRVELEELEEKVLAGDTGGHNELVAQLLHVRGDFTKMRAIVRPQRDTVERIARGESSVVRPKMLPYFRDVRDHLARIEETGTSYHERLLMAFDVYLNKAAFEANEGIKFLTALTALTLPIVLVGSWYGMNFEHMPELRSPHGYFFASLGTLIATIAMAVWLKKKRWF